MSIEQPEFDIEIDADLDRKADELIEVFQDDFGHVDYDDVVNSILEKSNSASLSSDIHYEARLYNMLFQKTDTDDLYLTSVDNYKARLYGLALKKIKLDSLRIEGTKELDDAALLVDWVRNCNSLSDLYLKSIKNEGVSCAFIQAANAYQINIEESHLTRTVIQTILDDIEKVDPPGDDEPEIVKEFDVDPCLEFRFERNWNRNRNSDDWYVAIRIEHINDELPTDLVTLLTNPIQNCTNLKKVIFDSISSETNDLLLLDAVVANTQIEEIEIKTFPISDVIIPMILNKSKSLKRLEVGSYAFEWCCNPDKSGTVTLHNINNNTARFYRNFFQKCTNLKKVIFDSINNDTNDLLLLDAVVSDTKMEEIEIKTSSISEVIIPMILNKAKSLKRLKVKRFDSYRYAFEWCCNQDQSTKVTLRNINNNTARFYANFFPKIIVRNLEIIGDDKALDDASQLIHFIRTSESLESIELWNMSNERVVRELLKAATENVNITEISAYKIHQIQDLIPTLLETSKSLTRLSMCGFSLDCSELGKEAISIEDVDNRTIPFYVQALTKRRLTEFYIKWDSGLDDGSLLIDWIKHSGSLKKFRCCSIRNEVVCRELLEAALFNSNVEHLYLERKCMRFLSNVLNQSKSLRCLELDERHDSVPIMWDDDYSGLRQANEFPLFEKESLSRLFKKENKHAQSRAMIEKLVLHCDCDRNFENVLFCLKENGTAGTFFKTVELKLENPWYGRYAIFDRLVSSLPTMRGVHELGFYNAEDRCFDAKDDFFSAMRKNFCLRRLNLIKVYDRQGKALEFQNDINTLCKRNETMQNWADVGYSMPKQYLYRTLLICQMYEFSQDIIYDLLKKYWCRRADHVIEAHKWTNYSSSDKIQRKRKRKET